MLEAGFMGGKVYLSGFLASSGRPGAGNRQLTRRGQRKSLGKVINNPWDWGDRGMGFGIKNSKSHGLQDKSYGLRDKKQGKAVGFGINAPQ